MDEEEFEEYCEMLRLGRYAPSGTPQFVSGTPECDAYYKRLRELREKATPGQLPAASKKVGF